MKNYDRVREAINGDHGEDQQRIAEQCLDLSKLLLQKNADYGGSAWKSPLLAQQMSPQEAIQCRMSDKIERLQNLLAGTKAEVAESTADTMQDLAGYCLLWLGAPEQ